MAAADRSLHPGREQRLLGERHRSRQGRGAVVVRAVRLAPLHAGLYRLSGPARGGVIVARYIVGRLLGMIPTALVLLLMVVLLMRLLPGSAVDIFLEGTGGDAQQKAEARRQMSHQLGLDRPLPEAYLSYVGAALHGDLGKSLWDKRPVAPQVLQRLLITGEIALVASVLAFIFGLPL